MASTELSLECKVQSYSMLLKYSFGDQQQFANNANFDRYSHDKLQEFVSHLEEERLKIDVFKRELPLCMQLLTNAVETSRRELQAYKTIEAASVSVSVPEPAKPFLEEFMPLKNSPALVEDDQKPLAIMSDKANWMTSLQLWSQASDVTSLQLDNNVSSNHSKLEEHSNSNQRVVNNNGAFVPFNKDRSFGPGNGVAAAAEMAELLERDENNNNSNIIIDGGVENGATTSHQSQSQRKARRCWSPDLHRRFVNALQMLGGSQVATPKQIRELMKVEGLTNDEVKSHLQKYRLHTRRPGPNPQASGPQPAQLVVLGLGGLWVPQEYAVAAPPTLYGPPATSHFYTPQEFYTTTAPPPHLQHHHHHPAQLYKGGDPPQPAQSSPESEVRDMAERSESFQEEKSGSSSWRIEGGDNGDVRTHGRRSAEGEESNRSEITLKF